MLCAYIQRRLELWRGSQSRSFSVHHMICQDPSSGSQNGALGTLSYAGICFVHNSFEC